MFKPVTTEYIIWLLNLTLILPYILYDYETFFLFFFKKKMSRETDFSQKLEFQ